MTGSEFRAIRKSLGLTSAQWGQALGYGRTPESAGVSVRKLERKPDRAVPETVARLAVMLRLNGIPRGWTSEPREVAKAIWRRPSRGR